MTMHTLMKRLALVGLIATLAGCNSTDALTPRVDVGSNGDAAGAGAWPHRRQKQIPAA